MSPDIAVWIYTVFEWICQKQSVCLPCLLKSEIRVNSPNLESFYMDMKKIKRFALLLIMASLAVNVQAQLEQAVKKIFAGDTVATHPTSLRRDSDSARVANLQKSLEEARLNEANMRMEMEQMRLQTMAADSVKLSQQRQRIDSCVNSRKEYR